MPLVKMTGIDKDLEDVVLASGVYDLEVVKVEADYTSKSSGRKMPRLVIVPRNVEGVDNPAPIYLYLPGPHDEDTTEGRLFKLRQAKRACYAFGVPIEDDAFDTDDFLNAQARLPLSVGENDRKEPVNEIQFPKVPHETPEGAKGGRRRRA